jgi:glycosyltransferase involved in cell wall biosynthesis
MKIRLIGQSNDSGIGTHYGQFARALQSVAGINQLVELIDHSDPSQLQQAVLTGDSSDINISFVCANLNGFMPGHNINWAVFESTRIPSQLFETMRKHTLWLPTEWARKIAIGQGIAADSISVIPEGVNTDLYHSYLIPEQEKFRFLLIGKYEQRKSVDQAITAFVQAFGNDPAVELVIKSDFFKNPELKYRQLTDRIAATGVDNIRLIWGYQTAMELANLYRTASVFLFPTRAEGWGLPLIEAAATGLPLITTYHSGQTEFLQHIRTSCVLLNYTLEPIDCAEYQGFYPEHDDDYGKWAVTTVSEIADVLHTAYSDYTRLRTAAVKNSQIIRTRYSWANSATLALGVLKQQGLI